MPVLFSGLMLSFGWLLRGQFGHEIGAMAPGAMAAVAAACLSRNDAWRKSFAWLVIWSTFGFSLGGGFSFGSLVNSVTMAPSLLSVIPELIQIFIIGAVWGGLGTGALGVAASSDHTSLEIKALIAGGLMVWIVNSINSLSGFQAILIVLGVFIALVLLFGFKDNPIALSMSLIGFMTFGLGFLISVILLFYGDKGYLSGSWWQISDMIWGGIGGSGILVGVGLAIRKGWKPVPIVWNPIYRIGYIWFAGILTAIETNNVYEKWFKSTPPAVDLALAKLSIIIGAIAIIVWFIYFLKVNFSIFSRNGLGQPLFWTSLFFTWYLAYMAAAKSVLYVGIGHGGWQIFFTAMFIEAALLTLVYPFYLKK